MSEFERTFDNSAIDYDRSRPMYVKELYDDIFRYKSVTAASNVLEIGIGTGKAAGTILERQCHLTALEPGEQLADITKKKFQQYDNFVLHNQMLQDYACPPETYDLIYSATAFHWIPEEYGYKRVYELLKKGGAFARFAYHAGRDKKREKLAVELQRIYEKYMHVTSEPKEFDEKDAVKLAETAKKYGFADTEYKLYHWRKDFTADEYMELLRTYPDHMEIEQPRRDDFFDEIRAVINENGGVISVYYTMDLELARK